MSEDSKQDQRYWRSQQQREQNEYDSMPKHGHESELFLEERFPSLKSELSIQLSRRSFISLMGASLALAGLTGCRRPVEKIIPYVIPPEEIIPGIPEYYATTMPFALDAYGLVVECHEGRPTKIEGNKDHPSTKGAANSFMLASILGLYDPDRSKKLLKDGNETDWPAFVNYLSGLAEMYHQNQGQGLAILSESSSSPTLARLKNDLIKLYTKAKWVAYEPISDENIFEGIKLATGKYYRPINHFEKAMIILALDSDFIFSESDNVASARGFADGRKINSENDQMNRLYVVESTFTVTGGMADHRLPIPNSQIGAFAASLAHELSVQGLSIEIVSNIPDRRSDFPSQWLKALAKDLIDNKGHSLVLAGRRQPPSVQLIVYAINSALKNLGNTISFSEMNDAILPNVSEYDALVKEMQDGLVSSLIILGGNPAYNSPADLNFVESLKKAKNTIHLSNYYDETSRLVHWHIPEAHYLESWGDARATEGTLSVIQPLIEPLFEGHSAIEIINLLTGESGQSGYDLVRQTWQDILKGADFEKKWRRVLHDGAQKNNNPAPQLPEFDIEISKKYLIENPVPNHLTNDSCEIVFCPSSNTFDGRFANNGWLQELSDPITKLTWDNAALLSPALAQSIDVENGDMIRLNLNGQLIELPVWIVPGLAAKTIGVILGYGRTASGEVGNGVGFNTYAIRTVENLWTISDVTIDKTGLSHQLASTQDHHSMEGRPIIREAPLTYYRANPDFAPNMVDYPPLESLWDEHKYDEGYQWGMAIDLNVCNGCNACTIACQSENNIPIVGKAQVARGREMHWIRVDRYFSGSADAPQMLHMPVPCQHCENAPCEQVCPVQATVHDPEGLNSMVYNRCVGTRYCSNNCPYKVRRFNFFNYTKDMPEIAKMAQNPDVTVRSRGVMEKCSYCIQRIVRAKIKAKLENRLVNDSEILTACQQACPTGAIVFGNIRDSLSRVAQAKKQNRNYGILAELNTKPRTTYLAKIRNPNPDIEPDMPREFKNK